MGRVENLLFRASPKRSLCGIPVAVLLFSSDEERQAAFDKIAAAMELIERHAPCRHAQVVRDLKRIFVCGDASSRGAYDAESGTCELFIHWVLSDETTPEALAATIVHEAQHARLVRLGVGYEVGIRARVERLCFRAARVAVRRMPGAEALAERADAGMALGEEEFADAAQYDCGSDSTGRGGAETR